MFKSYLRIAVRNILRDKFYAALNIMGLAIGLSCFIMISLWIKDELSYDRHYRNYQRIYRVESSLVTEGIPKPMATTDRRLIAKLQEQYSHICDAASVYKTPSLLSATEAKMYEEQTFYADASFFRIFSFSFIHGDPYTALNKECTVVITQSVAKKLFGNGNPIGETIRINNTQTKEQSASYVVTGVIKDDAQNSHFHPKAVFRKTGNMDTFEVVYVLLHKGVTPAYFKRHVWQPLYEKYFRPNYKPELQDITLDRLQPIAKIHLGGNKWEDLEVNSDPVMVYVFGAIALLILGLSCINYVNLATARSLGRKREIGVRKALGATRRQVLTQFMLEAVLISLIAVAVSLAAIEIAMPLFNRLAGKQMSYTVLDPVLLLYSAAIAVVAGIASGAYPAFYLSSASPVQSLKGIAEDQANKPYLRRSLVVLQFAISISMLIATGIIGRQLRFLTASKPGFDTDGILLVHLNDERVNKYRTEVKDALLKNDHVLNVAVSHNVPGGEINHTFINFETDTGMRALLINSMFVDQDYLDVMGLKLLEGRDFDSGMVPRLDTEAFVIINESAKKLLGYEGGAIGKKLNTGAHYGLRNGEVIGVVSDFHASSLHQHIEPLVLTLGTIGRPEGKEKFLTIKVRGDDLDNTISFIEKTYKAYGQGYPFQYSFLDREFNRQYRKEQNMQSVFTVFTSLSILSSLLGLIGLASFFIRQRTKEIVIRRISGASIPDIIRLLSTDYLKMALIAWLIACPIAYVVMQQWLALFAYRVAQGAFTYIAAGIAAFVLVLLTIILQAMVVINKRPASVLRHE